MLEMLAVSYDYTYTMLVILISNSQSKITRKCKRKIGDAFNERSMVETSL